ncbi:MAG: energy transducer TonB [Candidatus Omnitrophota bacterium]|jgi:TonB family protein
MPGNKVMSAAFLISFAGHCLFLGVPGIKPRLSLEIKKTQDKDNIKLSFRMEKPALLPRIDNMGLEKKFKEVKQEREQAKPEIKPLPAKEAVAQQLPRKRVEEKMDVISPQKEAMLRYQDMAKQRIEQARMYPLWAKKQGIEGIAYLYFIVLPNGSGQGVKLLRSSGSSVLDEEALATVKRASPFPPVPKEISSSSVSMEVAIVFSLNNKKK